MNAERIVKELRWLSKNDEWVFAAETMAEAADLIESLQAQLAKEKRRADKTVKDLMLECIECIAEIRAEEGDAE